MTGSHPTARGFPSLFIAALLLASACSMGGGASERLAEDAVNRLVVQDSDGNLLTMLPDGSEPVSLADDAGALLQFTQPTWSPDGTRVAWTELDGREGAAEASLVTAAADGSERTEAAVDFPPFYLLWDPTSSRVAYLGNGSSGLEMGMVDVGAGSDEGATIDAGQPFYLSWNPEGNELLVHVGTRRLDRLDLDGTATPIDDAPGAFNAPIWSRDGSTLVYAAAEPTGQQLIVRDTRTDERKPLFRFNGFISFVLSADGKRLAYQVRGQGAAPGLPASFAITAGRAWPLAQESVPEAKAGLIVVDLETGTQTTVTTDQAAAFFWSPDAEQLLSMHIDQDGSTTRAHWEVWLDGETIAFPPFLPSITMGRDYLPFFDQYAQNVSLWAPDGSAFTYAGSADDGQEGIWVQQVEEGADPVLVGDGVFSAWSPG